MVPHKAVAEVSKIRNLYDERLVAVTDGRHSEPTDAPTSAWRQGGVVVAVVEM